MKSLKHVQTISQVLSVLTKVAFVFCIIGATALLISACVLLALPEIGEQVVTYIDFEDFVGTFLEDLHPADLAEGIDIAKPLLGAILLALAVTVAGAAVVLGFVDSYFKYELAVGTPFTHRGANKLLRIGILGLAIPVGTSLLTSIIVSTATNILISAFPEAVAYLGGMEISLSFGADLTLGVVALLMSFLLHYGADVLQEKTEKKDA